MTQSIKSQNQLFKYEPISDTQASNFFADHFFLFKISFSGEPMLNQILLGVFFASATTNGQQKPTKSILKKKQSSGTSKPQKNIFSGKSTKVMFPEGCSIYTQEFKGSYEHYAFINLRNTNIEKQFTSDRYSYEVNLHLVEFPSSQIIFEGDLGYLYFNPDEVRFHFTRICNVKKINNGPTFFNCKVECKNSGTLIIPEKHKWFLSNLECEKLNRIPIKKTDENKFIISKNVEMLLTIKKNVRFGPGVDLFGGVKSKNNPDTNLSNIKQAISTENNTEMADSESLIDSEETTKPESTNSSTAKPMKLLDKYFGSYNSSCNNSAIVCLISLFTIAVVCSGILVFRLSCKVNTEEV